MLEGSGPLVWARDGPCWPNREASLFVDAGGRPDGRGRFARSNGVGRGFGQDREQRQHRGGLHHPEAVGCGLEDRHEVVGVAAAGVAGDVVQGHDDVVERADADGAAYLVLGRAVTEAPDPPGVLAGILESLRKL
jgi:hypothetical protein